MRRNKVSSASCFRSNSCPITQCAPALFESIRALKTRPTGAVCSVLAACVCFGTIGLSLGAGSAGSVNMDSDLQRLALHARQTVPEAQFTGVHSEIARVTAADKAQISGRWDANDRVLVHVHLNGQATLDEVTAQVQSMQGRVLDRAENYRHGILAAYLPTDQLENVAKGLGVRALTMEHRPDLRVGKYTSQGCAVLQTDLLNHRGLQGDGITLGVLSDSFDTAFQNTGNPPATTAPQDVATGDLPVVNVLQDFPNGTDEGRAICQILYDEAPHSHLAFATGVLNEIGFAQNILALRTQAQCDVIVDDVVYLDEPVFSDGFVAEAVNTVVNSQTLPGKRVIYASSAGNAGNNGYRNCYRNLSDQQVRRPGNHGNLKLVNDPSSPNFLDPALTAGGWYNWNPNGVFEPVTTVNAPGPSSFQYDLFLQWDDLFDEDSGITANYNFLVFDQDGNYLPALSGTSDAFIIQQPIQSIGNLNLGTSYQIAITKTTETDPKAGKVPRTHQLAIYSNFLEVSGNLTGKYFNPNPPAVPNIYGHPAADSAIAVAAYDFNWKPAPPYLPQLENFTSPGPVTIYFDANGKRLSIPEVRLKPEVAGVDGVITTFFGFPYYNYPFGFFGTSASAPSVAGVIALMLQAAGGPGSLDTDTVKFALENSAHPRTRTPEMAHGIGANRSGLSAVTAIGQSYFGSDYLTLNFFGVPGQSIESLTIDGSAPGLVFDTTSAAFAIGTTIGVNSSDVQIDPVSTTATNFTLTFKNGTFGSGASIAFTVGQNVGGTFPGFTAPDFGAASDAESLGSGGTFTVKFGGKSKNRVTAVMRNGTATLGYSPFDGFGLIDAIQAVEQVIRRSPRQN
jgi:hypothetical protein